MTTFKPKHMPVASFGPALMAALLSHPAPPGHQIRGEFKALYNLQLRLNMLRRAMKREGHPEWERAIQVKVSIQRDPPPATTAVLTIGPRDAEFDHLLASLDLDTKTIPLPLAEDETAQLDATLEALLKPQQPRMEE